MIHRRAGGTATVNISALAYLLFVTVILITTVGSAAEPPDPRTLPGGPQDKIKIVPNPIVAFTGLENYQTPDKQNWTRYKLAVKNYTAYPAVMFAPAPQLPPCGANKNASRTWVDIYYRDGKQQPHRLYGFCTLSSPSQLADLWFAVPHGQNPPSPVYIVLSDRATNTRYVSNPINIPLPAPTKPGLPQG